MQTMNEQIRKQASQQMANGQRCLATWVDIKDRQPDPGAECVVNIQYTEHNSRHALIKWGEDSDWDNIQPLITKYIEIKNG